MNKYKVDELSAGLPVGTILYWAGTDTNDLPSDWMVCNGAYLNSSTYADLYAQISTVYGGGLGVFALPNLIGMRIRGSSNFSSSHSGHSAGASNITINYNYLPSHSHGATNWNHNHSYNDAQKFHDAGGSGNLRYVTTGNSGVSDSNDHMRWLAAGAGTGNTSNQGSSSTFGLNPSFINLYAIIKIS